MVTPAGDRRLITLFPRAAMDSPIAVSVHGEGFEVGFECTKAWPAMVLLDSENQPLMATGTGPVTVNGQRIAVESGLWVKEE